MGLSVHFSDSAVQLVSVNIFGELSAHERGMIIMIIMRYRHSIFVEIVGIAV